MFLELSEFMIWIQSMPRVTYDYLWLDIGLIGLGMTIIVCVLLVLGRVPISAQGCKKRTLSHIWLRLYLPMFLFNVGFFTLM